eukprot:5523880-Pyramimonas_sp.AAC.1
MGRGSARRRFRFRRSSPDGRATCVLSPCDQHQLALKVDLLEWLGLPSEASAVCSTAAVN